MSSHTPPGTETLSTSGLRLILEIAGRFQSAWTSSGPPRIEEFLGEAPEGDRRELLRELLELEFGFLFGAGTPPDRLAYRARFPDQAALVDAVWAGFGPRSPETSSTMEPPERPDATTLEVQAATEPSDPDWADDAIPEWIGRYRVERFLGEGGYGRVFRAFDLELGRPVAIKVPHASRLARPAGSEDYLAEARIVAGLDHPGIVPVYDFGRTEGGACFIVSKFLEGGDLSKKIRLDRPSHRESAALLARVADAAEHAHRNGLVHRDIKPRNILLDGEGQPHLADFGAALRDEDFGRGPMYAGTPYYMSPEQARGEGHRVDARSDVFSLGVVLYELLTGLRPFQGATWRETIHVIKESDPRPPRQIDPSIPPELERICLRALSRRVADRHGSASALADDLRHFLEGRGPDAGAGEPAGRPLVPRGLRSFEALDAEPYLALLPGPRDRDGLPWALGFWIDRLSARGEDDPLRVGVIFGPSGSGKSSLVKAGLLPRLPRRVVSIRVEATPEGTESSLAAALRQRWPGLPVDADPARSLAEIRAGAWLPEGQQLLVVIDQFEQCLHAKGEADYAGLADALRQADGHRVRALVIVRDDFWISVTRFLRVLEVPLVEGRNGSAVDLFDPGHARCVLEEFGRAFGALPARPSALTPEQAAFLRGAVAGLASDGKVIPIQLSLFAEMVKGKAWTPSTLRAMGGARGVGAAFLEETFGDGAASPGPRRHREAARAVLEALLPGPGADLKGSTRHRSALVVASGYADRPGDFEELERILDHDLRLITPVDPLGPVDEPGGPSYQLTHDYLVPSIREWLARRMRESRSGRARLRLAERASLWNARLERKQLPSFAEWAGIRLFTRPGQWDDREAAMMRAADRHYAAGVLRAFGGAAVVMALAYSAYCGVVARGLIDGLGTAEPSSVPGIVDRMAHFRRWVDPPLRASLARARPGSRDALRARLALLPVDPAQAGPLAWAMLEAEPAEARAILRALEGHGPSVLGGAWRVLLDNEAARGRRLRAACLLATHAPDDPRWPSVASEVVAAVTAEDLFSLAQWSELLRPVRSSLLPALKEVFLASGDDPRGDVAAALVAEYAADRPELLSELILAAGPRQRAVVLARLLAQGGGAAEPVVEALEAIARPAPTSKGFEGRPADAEAARDRAAGRRADAALALLAMGRPGPAWAALRAGDDPRARTYLYLRIGRSGITPRALLRRLREEHEPAARQAILIALGNFPVDALPPSRRPSIVPDLVALYRDDPDPGVHSAVEWTMGRWGMADRLRPLLDEFVGEGHDASRARWFVAPDGQTMAVLPGPTEFRMGSPEGDPRRGSGETEHLRRIGRSFAIGTREVTVRQFLALMPLHEYNREHAPDPDCPVNRVSWFDGARYCRRLSEIEGLREDEMCYPRVEEIRPGMRMIPGYLGRPGYRYPTEAESEAAARAGTSTPRFYGNDSTQDVLNPHTWNYFNAGSATHPVGRTIPNPLGLFDALGNAYERCHDAARNYPTGGPGPVLDEEIPDEVIAGDSVRIIRGGAFHRAPDILRSAFRHTARADDPTDRVSFRIARTLP